MNKVFVNHSEMKSWIKANGAETTAMIGGEPGLGKTYLARALAAELNRDYAYVDCANMSLGDLTMPVIDRDQRCTVYYPNEILKLHTGDPIVLCIDEFTKGSREAQNMLLPIMYDRRLGSTRLHPDTIVVATGNMPDEGLGDKILPHQADRFALFQMRKPTAEEWISNYAVNNGINPTIMAFVDQFPQVMMSYHDDPQGENPYIFHPRVARNKVVTPRSLEMASKQLDKRELVSDDMLYASLCGTVGQAAAADLISFVNMNATLPKVTDIAANPASTPIPKDVAARILLVYNLIMRVTPENLEAVMKYVTRKDFPEELQALFVNKVLSAPSTAWAARHKCMGKHVVDLQHIFM